MKNIRRFSLLGVILVLVLVGGGLIAYLYWYQPTYAFFSTTDASVTGSFVRVAATASGQIYGLNADQGTSVKEDDVLATIQVNSPAASAPRLLAYVTSPISGTVAVRNVSAGETVAAGQSIASIVDLGQLWVVVNVDESRVNSVHVGQKADVLIGDVQQTFAGRVADIGSATNNILSPGISLASSSDATQKVPVKITFDYTGTRLIPGMGATVKIYTDEASR